MSNKKSVKIGKFVGLSLVILLTFMVWAVPAETQTFTTLYMFNGGTDGSTPMAGLLLGPKGNLYGTTEYGGNPSCSSAGCGTVFSLNATTSKYRVLHRFAAAKDGYFPIAGVVSDP